MFPSSQILRTSLCVLRSREVQRQRAHFSDLRGSSAALLNLLSKLCAAVRLAAGALRSSLVAPQVLLPDLYVAPLQLCEARQACWRSSARLLSPARHAAGALRGSLAALRGLVIGAAPRHPCEFRCWSFVTLVDSSARLGSSARLLGISAKLDA